VGLSGLLTASKQALSSLCLLQVQGVHLSADQMLIPDLGVIKHHSFCKINRKDPLGKKQTYN